MSKGGGGGAMQGGRGQQQTGRGQQQGGFGQQRGGFAQEQVGYGNQGGNYQYRNPRSSYMGNRGAKGGFGMQAPPPRSGLGNYGQQSDYRGSMGGKGGQQQRGYNPPSAPNYGEIGRGAMGRGSKGGMSNMGGGLSVCLSLCLVLPLSRPHLIKVAYIAVGVRIFLIKTIVK